MELENFSNSVVSTYGKLKAGPDLLTNVQWWSKLSTVNKQKRFITTERQ